MVKYFRHQILQLSFVIIFLPGVKGTSFCAHLWIQFLDSLRSEEKKNINQLITISFTDKEYPVPLLQ